MTRTVRFSLAVSEENLGPAAPVLFQGGLTAGIDRAAAAGFDAVEIHIRNPREVDFGAVGSVARDAGVKIAAVGTGLEFSLNGLSLTSPDSELRARTTERFREHIDAAGLFGATVFVGLCRAASPDDATRPVFLGRLAEALAPLRAHARAAGATLSIEPIARYMTNLLNTTPETVEFLDAHGFRDVLLLLDTHHMYLEHENLPAIFARYADRIGHVHISDSDRGYPGSGEIDYGAVGRSLKDIGYAGAVSLETLPIPDGQIAAERGIEWMRSIWGPP